VSLRANKIKVVSRLSALSLSRLVFRMAQEEVREVEVGSDFDIPVIQ